jgi:hypothetical protein
VVGLDPPLLANGNGRTNGGSGTRPIPPHRPHFFPLSGPRIFKLWRWNDKGLKAVSVAGISPAPRPLAGSGHRSSSGSSTPKSSAHVKSPTGQKAVPDFTDHAWLTDGTLAVANRDGVVFLVAEGQVQQVSCGPPTPAAPLVGLRKARHVLTRAR